MIVCSHDLLVQIRCFRVLEGQVACHHRIENHTTRPDICLQTVVALASDHLRNSNHTIRLNAQFESLSGQRILTSGAA